MVIREVLVADDSPTETLHLPEILDKSGFGVTITADNEQAMTKLEAETFDLILMGVMMPGRNNYQATCAIKKDEHFQDIPVIMCTAKGLKTSRVWGMRQGASDYIVESVETEELPEKIAKLAQWCCDSSFRNAMSRPRAAKAQHRI